MKNETAVNEKKMTNAEFDVKMDLYDSMRRQHGYLSIWSKYDVEDFDAVAFPDIKEVIYQSYWPRNDVVVGDVRNNTSNNYRVTVGVTSQLFDVTFKVDNLLMMQRDYNVAISSKGISHFTTDKGDLSYFVATESK